MDNVSFIIRKNDKVAIIGQNGQGKTTIIILLLRMYQADSGKILINGIDANQYNDSYLDIISIVFQDCSLFPITLFENIASTSPNEKSVFDSCQKVGVNQILDKNQLALDNLFSSEIYDDGVDLSKGEKQLFAIARALNRNGDLIILDEPSSAPDPIMRKQIMNHFNSLFIGKTTILITHDETFVKKCDTVLNLQNHTIQG